MVAVESQEAGKLGVYTTYSCSLLAFSSMADADALSFAALVAARLILASAPLPDVLKNDQQLSSPLTSYPRCAEVHL